ncbi:MAG: GntR family transcriptional regulator [Blastocatellia bacterium]|nr:GntR family transcriptional regulator [Blastocatellia bacterium]
MSGHQKADSLAGEAYVTLRERILRGELPIGMVVSRRKIALELGMSMLPVSEALQRLELEGLLESRPRAGTRVRIPTEEDVRGHYVVREALEVQAAKLFAAGATERERTELQRLAARVDALSARPDKDRFLYLTLHETLHRRIAEGAHCRPLCEAIEKNQVLASTWLCVPRPALSDEPPRRHQDLAAALIKGDPKAAAEAMRRHVNNALKNTLSRLESHFRMREEASRETYIRSPKKLAAPRTEKAAVKTQSGARR